MFAETSDQQVFESASRRFLETHYSTPRVRALAAEQTTFEPARWKEAAALGWTTLLVPEELGGGSISGNGLADLIIVSSLVGQHAAPGPLVDTNAVAAALARWGSRGHHQHDTLAAIVAGDVVASWGRGSSVVADLIGGTVALNGRVTNVESAADATFLLVTADESAGPTHYLVPMEAAGIELRALHSIDLTRRFHDVILRDVEVRLEARVGEPGSAGEHDELLLDIVAAIVLGEIVGAMERAFAMTLDWTATRHSFGRPLGSYQAVKHRIADMRTQLEASEAVAGRAAQAVGTGEADGRSWASAGMAYVGRCGPELIQECIQFHGGIGVTYEHDLHLFLRRATLDANLFGSSYDFARRLGSLVTASADES